MSLDDRESSSDRPAATPLTSLRAGASGRVRRVVADAPELLVRLSSFGVIPGAIVLLQQRLPAAVVRIGETTVALDTEIAARILVDPL